MCGRTSLFVPPSVVEERFEAEFRTTFVPRYNIAPRQDLYAIPSDDPDAIDAFEWGFLPQFVDDPEDSPRPINARAETVAEKPYFREAYEHRRCLVLADGFYEWSGDRGSKEPYRVQREDEQPFAFAGLWETWTPPEDEDGDGQAAEVASEEEDGDGQAAAVASEEEDGDGQAAAVASEDDATEDEAVRSLTIITTDSNDVVAPIHDRMPVILAADEEERWLADGDTGVLDPFETDPLEAYPVSTAVNDPTNESPEVIDPIDTEQSGFEEFTD
ncbi:MAG: SOS response-associated peptidase [Haloarculaceae archaeon]